MKRNRSFVILLVLLFLAILVIRLGAPSRRQIDWRPSFSGNDKIPYGAHVLRRIMPKIIGSDEITELTETIYSESFRLEDGKTCFFLNRSFEPDDLDVERLLDFVHRGNTLFVAAERFSEAFSDTLGFSLGDVFAMGNDSSDVDLVNPRLEPDRSYGYGEARARTHFETFDTVNSTALGRTEGGRYNYIRIRFGDGDLFISTIPYAFTNIYLLDSSRDDYAIRALSYLPKAPLIWDEYYKDGKRENGKRMGYVLSEPALKWALYLSFIAAALFILFEGKRRQRMIPIVRPVQNTSLEFVETVGRLYFQHGDHRKIAEKKITYFLEYVRSTFGLDTGTRDEAFFTALTARSGVDHETIRRLFGRIGAILSSSSLAEVELGKLNTDIEQFHREVKR